MSSTTTATLARAARRGVTLIEAILFISIALGLIVGGIVFYNQANTASTTNEAARTINAMASEIRALYRDRADFTGLDAATLVRAGGVPSNLVNGTTINNEFAGGTYTLGVDPDNNNQFFIQSNLIPDSVCARLGVISGGQGVVGTGIAEIRAYNAANPSVAVGAAFTGAPDDAATKCAADGAVALRITFTR
ncbi:MAG: type 4 pilus major pilin [Gemmobacter sp.]